MAILINPANPIPAVCAPTRLLAENPCYACLSDSELLQIAALLLARANSYTLPDDLPALLEQTACLTCLSKKQQLQAAVSVLNDQYGGGQTLATQRNAIRCMQCLQPAQIRALLLGFICNLFK